MNRQEHLLTIASEECAELAQRLSKIARFGRREVQDSETENPHNYTNELRAVLEYNDLVAVMKMLELHIPLDRPQELKKEKIEHFLEYSKQQGTLTE